MRVIPSSRVVAGHSDYAELIQIQDEILRRVGSLESIRERFPILVRDAVDFVLDAVRTARTSIKELDNVEKTFIGLKLEHFARDMLDVPKGLRDLVICGRDVDIKNTVGSNWSIPQETYRNSEPCLLMAVDEATHTCFLGLVIAKQDYLHGGRGNRDTKKGLSSQGFKNILWLLNGEAFPPSKFRELNMDRFRELRKTLFGNDRAAQFCRENLGRIVHRDVIQTLLFDQYDYMKRLRANGGAPDTLRHEGIAILIGTYTQDRSVAKQLGFSNLERDQIVAVKARSPAEERALRDAGVVS